MNHFSPLLLSQFLLTQPFLLLSLVTYSPIYFYTVHFMFPSFPSPHHPILPFHAIISLTLFISLLHPIPHIHHYVIYVTVQFIRYSSPTSVQPIQFFPSVHSHQLIKIQFIHPGRFFNLIHTVVFWPDTMKFSSRWKFWVEGSFPLVIYLLPMEGRYK